jgi:ureidoacrylate peracid hydrolase
MNKRADMQEAARKQAHGALLFSLAEKVAPGHAAILVIDMLNDFCAEQGMGEREGFDISAVQDMARRLPAFLDAARTAGVQVIFVRNVYSSKGNKYLSDAWLEQAARKRNGSYTLYPVCGEGEWGGEYYGGLAPQAGDLEVIKHRFDAFHNTDLDLILRGRGAKCVILTGCLTNVCVETTARDAFMRDYYVVVASDGTAAYTDLDHDQALNNIDRFFGEAAGIADISRAWQSAD